MTRIVDCEHKEYFKQTIIVIHVIFFSVLKSIEFSSGSPSDEVDGGPDKTKSLEMLLLEKNKSLQSENTQLKVSSSELSGESGFHYHYETCPCNIQRFLKL